MILKFKKPQRLTTCLTKFMPSPFERSKAELERQGFAVWKVERPASMYAPTLDLFNMIDLVAIRSDRPGVMGVQVCGEDVSPHILKILSGYEVEKITKNKETGKSEIMLTVVPPNPYIKTWLEAGNPFFIWGWRLLKNEGKKASFQLREVEFVINADGTVVAQEVSHDPN